MPVTTGMKGDGWYDRHSSPQMAAIDAVLPWLLEAVGNLRLGSKPGPVVIADFGCSEGRNSIAATKRIIEAVGDRHGRSIQTIHSDLPTNNFNQLFANLHPGGNSVFAAPDVFSAAVSGSMFDQLLPSNSVAVASTFNAIGFLNQRPATPVPDYILPMGPGRPRPGVDVSPEARQAYAAQARDDLVRFYEARAAEMITGGKLLVASFGSSERHRACDGIYDVVNDALLDLVANNRLRREAYERLVLPIYFRSVQELIEPVANDSFALSTFFQLDKSDTIEVAVPFNERFQASADVFAYAKEYTNFIRAFTEPIIRMTFEGEPGLDSVITELYAKIEARLADDPVGYAFRFVQVAALLTRR